MTMSDPMIGLLTAAGISGSIADSNAIRRLGATITGGDSVLVDGFVLAVSQNCDPIWDSAYAPEDTLDLRLGGWHIDLSRQAVKAGLVTAIVATALVAVGLTPVGVAVVTLMLPIVLDIKRVELSPSDERLLIELRRKPALQEGYATEDELYASLPAETQAVINRYDFADFVQRVKAAGLAQEGGEDWIRIRDADYHRPWISID